MRRGKKILVSQSTKYSENYKIGKYVNSPPFRSDMHYIPVVHVLAAGNVCWNSIPPKSLLESLVSQLLMLQLGRTSGLKNTTLVVSRFGSSHFQVQWSLRWPNPPRGVKVSSSHLKAVRSYSCPSAVREATMQLMSCR